MSTKVTIVYQNTLGILFVVDNNRFYSVSFPDLNIQIQITNKLALASEINVVCQTSSGNKYISYNNSMFIAELSSRGSSKFMFQGKQKI